MLCGCTDTIYCDLNDGDREMDLGVGPFDGVLVLSGMGLAVVCVLCGCIM